MRSFDGVFLKYLVSKSVRKNVILLEMAVWWKCGRFKSGPKFNSVSTVEDKQLKADMNDVNEGLD